MCAEQKAYRGECSSQSQDKLTWDKVNEEYNYVSYVFLWWVEAQQKLINAPSNTT